MNKYKRERKIDSTVNAETDDYLTIEADKRRITKSMLVFEILQEKATGITLKEKDEMKIELAEEIESQIKNKIEIQIEFIIQLMNEKIDSINSKIDSKIDSEIDSKIDKLYKMPKIENRQIENGQTSKIEEKTPQIENGKTQIENKKTIEYGKTPQIDIDKILDQHFRKGE